MKQYVLGLLDSDRYGFHLMELSLDSVRKQQLVTPIIFIALLYQRAYLVGSVIGRD